MERLKALIIEDEIGSVNVIMQLLALNAWADIHVVGVAETVFGGIELIKEQRPDILFMDIELKDGSSFEILERLDSITFKLVFITAFDKFAIDAFRFSAMDYLLKPIDNKLFLEMLHKLVADGNNTYTESQYSLLKEIRQHNIIEKVNKIALVERNEIQFQPLDQIVYLMAKESYTEIHTTESKHYLMSKNLGYYEELLSQHPNFFRIHYSTLVNLDFILKVVKDDNTQKYTLHLSNGKQFDVSQRRVSEFRKFIKI